MNLFSSTGKVWQDEGNGNLRIKMHFLDALPTTVNVIAYAEFESVLEIDKSRKTIYDYRDGYSADRQTTSDGPAH